MIVKNDLVLKSQWFKPRCRNIQQILELKWRWKIIFFTLKTSGNIWDYKNQRTITSRFHGRFNDTENDSHICIESELNPCQKHTYLIKVWFSQQWLKLEQWFCTTNIWRYCCFWKVSLDISLSIILSPTLILNITVFFRTGCKSPS